MDIITCKFCLTFVYEVKKNTLKFKELNSEILTASKLRV